MFRRAIDFSLAVLAGAGVGIAVGVAFDVFVRYLHGPPASLLIANLIAAASAAWVMKQDARLPDPTKRRIPIHLRSWQARTAAAAYGVAILGSFVLLPQIKVFG